MKLTNFTLEETLGAIGVNGLGLYWDLHNYAVLKAIDFNVIPSFIALHWATPDIANVWGDEKNRFSACLIEFTGVKEVRILGDFKCHGGEEISLESLSQTDSLALKDPYLNVAKSGDESEEFGLLFSFYGGLTVEVFSDFAELRGIN